MKEGSKEEKKGDGNFFKRLGEPQHVLEMKPSGELLTGVCPANIPKLKPAAQTLQEFSSHFFFLSSKVESTVNKPML